MTVIYLDTLFFLNLGLDGLLLASAKALAGCRISWKRTLLAAAAGAGYSAAVFLTRWSVLLHPLTRLGAALGMVWLAAEQKNALLRVLGLFFLLSCALAGTVMLMDAAGLGSLSSSVGFPVSGRDGRLLLLCGAGEYLLVSLLQPSLRRSRKTVSVLLRCEGRTVLLRALVDTGNLLRDPVTGQGVMVGEWSALLPLFPPEARPSKEVFFDPGRHLEALIRQWSPARLRVLPYRAIGTAGGLLLALRVDEMEVEGRIYHQRLVAVTGQTLSAKGEYQGIIGTDHQEGIG